MIWRYDFRSSTAPERCEKTVNWQPDPAAPALVLDVAEVVKPIQAGFCG